MFALLHTIITITISGWSSGCAWNMRSRLLFMQTPSQYAHMRQSIKTHTSRFNVYFLLFVFQVVHRHVESEWKHWMWPNGVRTIFDHKFEIGTLFDTQRMEMPAYGLVTFFSASRIHLRVEATQWLAWWKTEIYIVTFSHAAERCRIILSTEINMPWGPPAIFFWCFFPCRSAVCFARMSSLNPAGEFGVFFCCTSFIAVCLQIEHGNAWSAIDKQRCRFTTRIQSQRVFVRFLIFFLPLSRLFPFSLQSSVPFGSLCGDEDREKKNASREHRQSTSSVM